LGRDFRAPQRADLVYSTWQESKIVLLKMEAEKKEKADKVGSAGLLKLLHSCHECRSLQKL
jgi:hypothetical protein